MSTIFEKSNNVDGINLCSEELSIQSISDEYLRTESIGLPQTSEMEVLRHYKSLSDKNFCVETGMYPLGSCTMKYNPKGLLILKVLLIFTHCKVMKILKVLWN